MRSRHVCSQELKYTSARRISVTCDVVERPCGFPVLAPPYPLSTITTCAQQNDYFGNFKNVSVNLLCSQVWKCTDEWNAGWQVGCKEKRPT